MARFLTLIRFTEQGLQTVYQSCQRADNFRAAVLAAGGSVISQYWTLGECDGCVMFEAPDEETAASLVLALVRAGNVRTQTMRLFNEKEFSSIVDKT